MNRLWPVRKGSVLIFWRTNTHLFEYYFRIMDFYTPFIDNYQLFIDILICIFIVIINLYLIVIQPDMANNN